MLTVLEVGNPGARVAIVDWVLVSNRERTRKMFVQTLKYSPKNAQFVMVLWGLEIFGDNY